MADEQTPTAAGDKPKTERELERERKKEEKLKKLAEKKAKQSAAPKAAPAEKSKTKAISEVPEYVEQTPAGEKKILIDLDKEELKAYNPKAVESAHYSWWEKEGFFKPRYASENKPRSEGSFVIIEPPPNVTGLLHMGHALSGTLQDIMIR